MKAIFGFIILILGFFLFIATAVTASVVSYFILGVGIWNLIQAGEAVTFGVFMTSVALIIGRELLAILCAAVGLGISFLLIALGASMAEIQ